VILRELFMRLGFQVDNAALEQADGRLSSLASRVRGVFATVAVGAAARRAVSFVEDVVALGDSYGDLAAQTGLSATELREWQEVATLSGTELSTVTSSLGRLTRTMGAASDGNARARATFRELGVSVSDSAGRLRPAGDVMEDVVGAMSALPNETRRNALAMRLFGGSGRAMAGVFAQGADGVARIRREIRELYGDDFEAFSAASGRVADAQDRTNTRLEALRVQVALYLMPYIERFVGGLQNVTTWLANAARSTTLVRVALVALAVAAAPIAIVAAVAGLVALGPGLAALWVVLTAGAAQLAFLAAAVDDVMVAIEGGQSITGQWATVWGTFIFGAERAHYLLGGLRLAFAAFSRMTGPQWLDALVAGLRSTFPLLSAFVPSLTTVSALWLALAAMWRRVEAGARSASSTIAELSDTVVAATARFTEFAQASGLGAVFGLPSEAGGGRAVQGGTLARGTSVVRTTSSSSSSPVTIENVNVRTAATAAEVATNIVDGISRAARDRAFAADELSLEEPA
jgi:hypothetical protein